MIQTDKVLSVDQGHPERSERQCWLVERGWRGGLFITGSVLESAPTGVSGGPRVGRGWTSREPGQADSSRHSENSPQTRAGHWINNFPHPRLLPPSLPRGPGHVTREGGGLVGVWPSWRGCYGLPWWLRGKQSKTIQSTWTASQVNSVKVASIHSPNTG